MDGILVLLSGQREEKALSVPRGEDRTSSLLSVTQEAPQDLVRPRPRSRLPACCLSCPLACVTATLCVLGTCY